MTQNQAFSRAKKMVVMAKLMALLVFCIAVAVEGTGRRSRAGAGNSEKECVPCSFEGIEKLCFPPHRLPPESSGWVCRTQWSEDVEDNDLWDCLMAASDGPSCRSFDDGSCVWCAEPIFGLCVTRAVADKIGNLPFFTCDDPLQATG
mmetsp:Transcript_22087/g.50959  ORF Transcript_22087/g.50959 Transcript_22087/m.50959 type:complete len:147 (+) Transcript_22087:420-860(+)